MANIFQKTRTFYTETVGELKKASWPDFNELKGSTLVIVVSVLILGLYVAISDLSVFQWVTMLTRLIKVM
jgi:preprotein translocase subunit SecE